MPHHVGQTQHPRPYPVRSATDALGGKYDPLAGCPDLLDNLSYTARQPMAKLTRFPGVRQHLAKIAARRAAAAASAVPEDDTWVVLEPIRERVCV
ncbi:MAG: hypothetical protein QOJ50_3274 [Cryptosporangiaceae bacterium]|nr:hypothetical protein [Cryptosporangiaceae bacterium]